MTMMMMKYQLSPLLLLLLLLSSQSTLAYMRGTSAATDDNYTQSAPHSQKQQHSPEVLVPCFSPAETTAAAGAPSSFCRNAKTKEWTPIAASDLTGESRDNRIGLGNDNGGRGVAFSGTTIAVATHHAHQATRQDQGSISVYEYDSHFTGEYQLVGDVIYGTQNGEQAGFAIALVGDVLAVGAIRYKGDRGNYQGAARVYRLDRDYYPPIWKQVGHELHGPQSLDHFGHSVALSASGRTLAVGAVQHYGNPGKPYGGYVEVYSLNQYDHWVHCGRRISGLRDGDRMGHVVAMNSFGSIVAVSAPSAHNSKGAIDVYRLSQEEQWLQLGQTLQGEREGDMFGAAIELSQDGMTVAIGAPHAGETIEGTATVYRLSIADQYWRKVGDTLHGTAGSGFGTSLSLDDARLVVGAPHGGHEEEGQVHVFDYNKIAGSWELQTPVLMNANAAPSGMFGSSVALQGDRLVVSSPYADDEHRGSVQTLQLR